jgi:hypothetical protein
VRACPAVGRGAEDRDAAACSRLAGGRALREGAGRTAGDTGARNWTMSPADLTVTACRLLSGCRLTVKSRLAAPPPSLFVPWYLRGNRAPHPQTRRQSAAARPAPPGLSAAAADRSTQARHLPHAAAATAAARQRRLPTATLHGPLLRCSEGWGHFARLAGVQAAADAAAESAAASDYAFVVCRCRCY